jgi:Amt family ammonium transporter
VARDTGNSLVMLFLVYKEQVTTELFLGDVFYMIAGVAVLFAILGIGLIDAGLVDRRHIIDTWVQKLTAAIVGAFAFVIIGYAVWEWQFYQAFGVPHALSQAISDWWIGGPNMSTPASLLDPKKVPEADVLQVFAVFFITFAMLVGAVFHSSGLERIKPAALYVMTFVAIAGPWSYVTYLAWGSASPLTNAGAHDYIGVFNFYIFVGTWSIILNWRLGPRVGAFTPAALEARPLAPNFSLMAAGLFLILFAVPFVVLGSGFIEPGIGYFGISMTSSGFGVALINVLAAFIGGGLVGSFLAYRLRNPLWALFGPLTGYISGAALMDIATPLQTLIVAAFAPVVAFGTYRLLGALRIDDQKIGPLTFGTGVYGALVAGFIGWHVKTGGFFGLTGPYGFQHAEITPQMQLATVAVTICIAGVSCLVLAFVLDKTIGLRVSAKGEESGLDAHYWDAPVIPR